MKRIDESLYKFRSPKRELEVYGGYGDEYNGIFNIPVYGQKALVVVSNGMGWEHVSVSFKSRVPTWKEMCYIKSLFFDDEETVIQYHPKKSNYINVCDTCLHLWRPINDDIPLPPAIMV